MEVCDKVKAIVVSLYMECRILMGARDISDVLIMIVGGRLREHMTKASKNSAGVILCAGGILHIRVANNDCQSPGVQIHHNSHAAFSAYGRHLSKMSVEAPIDRS